MHEDRRRSGVFVNGVHHTDFPVYYEDTDAGGVVYYANYLRYAERGRTEALHLAGIDHRMLRSEYDVMFVARRCVIDYLRPGRLDDLLSVRTCIHKMRNTSLLMHQEIGKYTEAGIEELAVIDAFMVCVNTALRPSKMPEPVRKAIYAYMPPLQLETAS